MRARNYSPGNQFGSFSGLAEGIGRSDGTHPRRMLQNGVLDPSRLQRGLIGSLIDLRPFIPVSTMEIRRESALRKDEVSLLVANCYELSFITFIARGGRKCVREGYTASYNLIISVISGLIKSLCLT